jgi:serine/threonine-protein kinase ULK1
MDSDSTIEPNPSHLPENLPCFTGHLIDNGRIIIQNRLDAGSFGSVYLASSTGPDAVRYAVKCMPKLDLNDSRRCQLQVNEIALHTIASSHPNIVTLHKHIVSEDHKYLFLVLGLAKDGNLRKRVSTFVYEDDKIKDAMSQIIDGVQHLHDVGVYHRDLKLENILIDGGRYLVADLGLATREALSDGFNCGSLEYISPGEFRVLFAPSTAK